MCGEIYRDAGLRIDFLNRFADARFTMLACHIFYLKPWHENSPKKLLNGMIVVVLTAFCLRSLMKSQFFLDLTIMGSYILIVCQKFAAPQFVDQQLHDDHQCGGLIREKLYGK